MHIFGIALLFGSGWVMSVARWLEYPLTWLREKTRISVFSLIEVALGIVLAWAVDSNVWRLLDVPMRAD
ncbi:MAG: hypothetical protein M0Z96_08440 [Actinomycetota bacterium]|nr:hypothetical protein [Actinomycetota bacterium]